MEKTLIILLVILAFSCKKEEPPVEEDPSAAQSATSNNSNNISTYCIHHVKDKQKIKLMCGDMTFNEATTAALNYRDQGYSVTTYTVNNCAACPK